jgi:hypothetical protein
MERCYRTGGKTIGGSWPREGSSPNGRDAQRPGESIEGGRVEPDLEHTTIPVLLEIVRLERLLDLLARAEHDNAAKVTVVRVPSYCASSPSKPPT